MAALAADGADRSAPLRYEWTPGVNAGRPGNLERYVFVEIFRGAGLRAAAARRRRMALGRTAALLTATFRPGRTAATTAAAVTEELELLQHHFHAAAFFLGVFVLPLIEAQAAFDVERAA